MLDEIPMPESGWNCVRVEDYAEASQHCEVCNCERVRYVHVMQHEELPLTRLMGRVCAGKYGGDTVLPKLREKNLRNRAKRRSNWLTRRWRVSRRGNEYLNVEGLNVGVFQRGSDYGYWYQWEEYEQEHPDDQRDSITIVTRQQFSTELYQTEESAKLALFDALWPLEECFNITEAQ